MYDEVEAIVFPIRDLVLSEVLDAAVVDRLVVARVCDGATERKVALDTTCPQSDRRT
jgi:hypothetical protein